MSENNITIIFINVNIIQHNEYARIFIIKELFIKKLN